MAEARLDQRRYLDSDKNVPVSSSESVLLKIITSTNDVEFNDITIEDFGVRFQIYFYFKTFKLDHFSMASSRVLCLVFFFTTSFFFAFPEVGKDVSMVFCYQNCSDLL